MGEIWINGEIRQDPLRVVSASIFLFWLGVSEERLLYTLNSLVGNSYCDGIEPSMSVDTPAEA